MVLHMQRTCSNVFIQMTSFCFYVVFKADIGLQPYWGRAFKGLVEQTEIST